MRKSILSVLVDPDSKRPLRAIGSASDEADGIIRTGELIDGDRRYPILNGIPRFVIRDDSSQAQTEGSFGFKWGQRNTYESAEMRSVFQRWFLERYGFASIDDMRRFFGARRRILDAGCGSAFSASLWLSPEWRTETDAEWFGADISSAIDVAQDRVGGIAGTHFVQADVLRLPFAEGTFDTIVSEGVLHHTPSTERALHSVALLLAAGGELMFYVYRRKAPVREFTDDFIRAQISELDPETAWDQLKSVTALGKALAELHAEVEVPDVPVLGIKAGRYDVQRLMYWNFLKAYWNPELSFDENHHINFDWHHPKYAHRQTEQDVRGWCRDAGLTITRFDVQESGFTVRAIKH